MTGVRSWSVTPLALVILTALSSGLAFAEARAEAPPVPFISITSTSTDHVHVLYRSGDNMVLAECKPPVVNPVTDCNPDTSLPNQTARNYDLILRNHLGVSELIPAYARSQYLNAQIDRLNERIRSSETPAETVKRLQAKVQELQSEIASLQGPSGHALKDKQNNFTLYGRIVANLGITSLPFPPQPDAKGWGIDQEDRLSDYGVTSVSDQPLSQLLKFPVKAVASTRKVSTAGLQVLQGRQTPAVVIPSAYDPGNLAELRIALSPEGQIRWFTSPSSFTWIIREKRSSSSRFPRISAARSLSARWSKSDPITMWPWDRI